MTLQTGGRQTAGSLARTLEVSVRTVLRDIDQLSAAGVPISGDRGRKGGFELLGGWTTQLTGMTEDEAAALPLAPQPATATLLGVGAAALSARLKLMSGLPPAWREQAERVGNRLHVDHHEWHHQPDPAVYLREVANALWRSKRLEVEYESWKGIDRRTLEPLGIVIKAGTWYLVARAMGGTQTRAYRVARIRSLSVGATFSYPKDFNLQLFWTQSAKRFESELLPLRARVLLSPRGLAWLPSRIGATASSPEVPPSGDGQASWIEVTYPLESIERGARQLLAFGAELQVLEPAELREALVRLASAVVATHARTAPRARRRNAAH
jgi:predicted DNA-binding transcriptional regulator YafY